jgi:hypothetical protein
MAISKPASSPSDSHSPSIQKGLSPFVFALSILPKSSPQINPLSQPPRFTVERTFVFITCLCLYMHSTADAAEKMSLSYPFLNGHIKLGGQYLLRQEMRSNYYTQDGRAQTSDDFLTSRVRIATDINPTDDTGFFFMLTDTRDYYSRRPHEHPYLIPFSYDHPMDIQQCYAYLESEDSPISFWAGRREVIYLKERLIGTSIGWTTKVITYDGATLTLKMDKLKFDLLYLNKVIPIQTGRRIPLDERRYFNDGWFGGPADLYGFWLTSKEIYPKGNIETYGLYDDRDDGNDSYTFGLRAYGKAGGFDYDINGTLQFGTFNSLDRKAGATYLEAGYTFSTEWKPRLGVEYNFASGDGDPNDSKYNTFDDLYACVHGRYGLMEFFRWRNMHEININATAWPHKDVKASARFHTFWLAESEDAWYNTYNKIQRWDPTGRARSFVGNEIDIILEHKFLKYFTAVGFYGHFFPGGYVADTGESKDADYTYFELRFEF